MRAMLALDTIFRIRPPPEVGVSLWRHVWPWFYFIHTYWAHLPGIDIVPEKSFYIDFLLFAGGFRELPLSSSVMLATPGFKVLTAKVLSFLPGLEEPNLEAVLDCIYNFIGDFNFSNPANLSELTEGAGGTIDDLAGLVVQYIRIVVGRRPQYIRGICFSLRDAEPSLETEQQRSLPPLGALHSILLYHGLVRALVAAMLPVSTTAGPETDFVLDECFMLLERILLASPGYLWIEEAMDAGLIQVIVSCATGTRIGQVTLHLHFFLDLVFPAGLLSYYTLHKFRCSYARVQELVSTEEFQTCDISSHWGRFMCLANERLEFLAAFDSAEFVSPTACDNLACGKLKPKIAFGRCSGCKAFYYCGPACQAVDWQDGHRKFCSLYRSLCLSELAHPQLLVRERAFLRALMHDDYIKHLSHISAEQVKFITNNPTCKLFITLFNYCDGALQIEIHPTMASPLSAALQETGPEWMDLLTRAQRSEHRLHLHVVKVPQGLGAKHWVVPLRTSSPTFQQAMRLLATNPGDQDIMEAIESVLRHELDAPGIH
ncbi:hypothetical protein B0H14DRAFT_2809315 [Mycena olivaceomarginata]|nr:hypothetical protein B0H14DRAFT_2809315 [Mycena olivaceomarginata]